MEGVTIFKLDTYYVLGSHLTGWAPNAAQLCMTPNDKDLNNAKWVITSILNQSLQTDFNFATWKVHPIVEICQSFRTPIAFFR